MIFTGTLDKQQVRTVQDCGLKIKGAQEDLNYGEKLIETRKNNVNNVWPA